MPTARSDPPADCGRDAGQCKHELRGWNRLEGEAAVLFYGFMKYVDIFAEILARRLKSDVSVEVSSLFIDRLF